MAETVKNDKKKAVPTVIPALLSPKTPGPLSKMIAIIFAGIVVFGIITLGAYFYFSGSDKPLDNEPTTSENTTDETDEEETEDEEANKSDTEITWEAVAENVLKADSISYTYTYDSGNTFALNISDSNPDGRLTGALEITAEYKFRAIYLSDPDKRIIRQDLSMLYNPLNGDPNTVIEFSVIRHQDNLYLQLSDITPGRFLPLAKDTAINSLKGKWLSFTLDDGQIVELNNGDLDHLRDTDTGFLLSRILTEMILPSGAQEGEILIPLSVFAGASYVSSPFIFGVPDSQSVRQDIFNKMVSFADNQEPEDPKTLFVVGACNQDVDETITCDAENQIFNFKAKDTTELYNNLLEQTNLIGALPVFTEADWRRFVLRSEDITDHQLTITLDTNLNLPLLLSTSTSFSAEQTASDGSSNKIDGQTSVELAYDSFSETPGISLPTVITPLADLQ